MEDRRRALWILIALFGVLSALLIWSFAYRAATTFETGKPPAIPQVKPPDPIRPEIRSTDQARGSSDPNAVVIVEFADFSCLYCRASEPELRAVLREDKNVRHIWRDMPVASDSPSGMLAASAGRCAAEQNRFWEMHGALMDAARLDAPTITTISRTIGLNTLTFDECLSSGRHVASIQQDIEIAREAGMTGAPTFFIGNKTVLTGYVTAADLRWAILKAKFGQ